MTYKKTDTDESSLKDITGGSVDYNKNHENWNQDTNIPKDAGSYKLGKDVELNSEWKPSIPFENNTIDVNNNISGGIIYNSNIKKSN